MRAICWYGNCYARPACRYDGQKRDDVAGSSQSGVVTILVVDDDVDTREYLVVLLSFEGYHTLEAGSGAAALAAVAGHTVQAVLLDLRLPDMDGLAVCRRLRASGLQVPIVLVTADHRPDIRKQAGEAGVTSFLAKPFVPQELLDRLKQVAPA